MASRGHKQLSPMAYLRRRAQLMFRTYPGTEVAIAAAGTILR